MNDRTRKTLYDYRRACSESAAAFEGCKRLRKLLERAEARRDEIVQTEKKAAEALLEAARQERLS